MRGEEHGRLVKRERKKERMEICFVGDMLGFFLYHYLQAHTTKLLERSGYVVGLLAPVGASGVYRVCMAWQLLWDVALH